jgi:hypothetical protein
VSNGKLMAWVVKAWKPDAFAARLAALEELGDELREDVRRRRGAPREEITLRKGRASLRDSPLTELFRATAARPPGPGRPKEDALSREGSRFAHSGAHAAGAVLSQDPS